MSYAALLLWWVIRLLLRHGLSREVAILLPRGAVVRSRGYFFRSEESPAGSAAAVAKQSYCVARLANHGSPMRSRNETPHDEEAIARNLRPPTVGFGTEDQRIVASPVAASSPTRKSRRSPGIAYAIDRQRLLLEQRSDATVRPAKAVEFDLRDLRILQLENFGPPRRPASGSDP